MANIVETFVRTDVSSSIQAFNRLEGETKRAGRAFDQMGQDAERGLGRAARAVTMFKAKWGDGLDYVTKKFEHGMKRAVQAAALSGTVYAGLAGRNFLEFDKGATVSATVMLDQSPAAKEKLRAQVLALSKELGIDVNEIWASNYDIFSSVADRLRNNDDSIDLGRKIAKGAVAANTDMQSFGSTVMGVMNTYKLGVKDVDHVTDVFFQTLADGANTTGPQLALGFGKVNKSGQQVGATFEQVAAAAAYVTKNGGDAEENLTSLDNLFNQLRRQQTGAALKAIGINIYDKKGMRLPFMDMFGQIKKKYDTYKTDEKKDELLNVIFAGGGDIRANRGMFSLLDNYNEMNKAAKRYKDSVGVTDAAYKHFLDSSGYNIKIGLNKVRVFGMEAIEALNPFINMLVRGEKDTQKLGAAWDVALVRLRKVSPELENIFRWGGRAFGVFTGSDMHQTIKNLEHVAIAVGTIYGLMKGAQLAKWATEWYSAAKIGKGGIGGGVTGVMNVKAGVVNVVGGVAGAAGGAAGGAGEMAEGAVAGSLLKKVLPLIGTFFGELGGGGLLMTAAQAGGIGAAGYGGWELGRFFGSRQIGNGLTLDDGVQNLYANMFTWDEKKKKAFFMHSGMPPGGNGELLRSLRQTTLNNNITIRQDQPILLNGIEVGRVKGQFPLTADVKIMANPSQGASNEIPLTVPVGAENLK